MTHESCATMACADTRVMSPTQVQHWLVSSDVLRWVVSTLDRLVRWHLLQSPAASAHGHEHSHTHHSHTHQQEPSLHSSHACSGATADGHTHAASDVMKDVPALVACMSIHPELSIPIANILLNTAQLDGGSKVCQQVMSCQRHSHNWSASADADASVSASTFSSHLAHSPLARKKSQALGDRNADADAVDQEQDASSLPGRLDRRDIHKRDWLPKDRDTDVCGGVEAIHTLLRQVGQLEHQRHSLQTHSHKESDSRNKSDSQKGDKITWQRCESAALYSDCYQDSLTFAAECVLAMCVGVEMAALDSEKGAVVLQDVQQQGVSRALACSAQRRAGDRYFEIPTWLAGEEEEEASEHRQRTISLGNEADAAGV